MVKRVARWLKAQLKLNWHCLWKLATAITEDHRACTVIMSGRQTQYFCGCGYMNNGVKWDEVVRKLQRGEW